MTRIKRSEDPEAPDPNDVTEMSDREFEEFYDNNWREYDQEAEINEQL